MTTTNQAASETNAPYTPGKKKQVSAMFNGIAKRYDLLNRLLSAGIDVQWRRKGLRLLEAAQPKKILDVATGTGDLAIEANRLLSPDKIIGVDISEGMLQIGREKVAKLGLGDKIELQMGDSEKLLFEDGTFDAVTVAFGVRNYEDLAKGLREMCRVLKPGGQCMILELTRPEAFPMKQAFSLYSDFVLPTVGKLISRDSFAYRYLPDSVKSFPAGQEFLRIYQSVGFKNVRAIPLTFGICTVYLGEK